MTGTIEKTIYNLLLNGQYLTTSNRWCEGNGKRWKEYFISQDERQKLLLNDRSQK